MDNGLLQGQINTLLTISKNGATEKESLVNMASFIMENKEECKAMLEYLEKSNFYEGPSSAKFHGNCKGGLLTHTLRVITEALTIAPAMIERWEESAAGRKLQFKVSAYDIFISAMAHDYCKIGLYKEYQKNVKDDKGAWKAVTAFMVDNDNRNLGHGEESVLRVLKCVPSLIDNRMVLEAIRMHMGAFDIKDDNKYNYSKIMCNPVALIVQTADIIASSWCGQ